MENQFSTSQLVGIDQHVPKKGHKLHITISGCLFYPNLNHLFFNITTLYEKNLTLETTYLVLTT